MGKTRRRGGGNNNLNAINSSLFVNKRRGVNFISSPMIQEYELNEAKGTRSGKWTSMAKYPQQFKSESAEIKNMLSKAKEYGLSNKEINESVQNVKKQWHNSRSKNRRLAVRLGNTGNMTKKNINEVQKIINKQNMNQQFAQNYAKFIANVNMNAINSNVPANIAKALKAKLPTNFSNTKRNYFTKKINANFRG